MRSFDFHFHCNSGAAEDVAKVLELCKKLDTVVALSGGLRYGGHDFLPNEQVLELCKKNPDWFVPLAKFDLWDKVEVDLIYRWKEAGFKGIKFIYPYYEYDHDLYMPVYEACEKVGFPVLFHTGNYRPNPADILWKRPVLKNMHPITLDRIARSFQKLNIVMAHMGTALFRELGAGLTQMLPNLYADLAGCGNWMGVSPQQLDTMMQPVPHRFQGNEPCRNYRKLIFGSDGYMNNPEPLITGKTYYEQSLMLNAVPQEIRDGVMGKTAASWVGIEL